MTDNLELTTSSNGYMPPIKSDVHLTPDRVWDIIEDTWSYHKSLPTRLVHHNKD